MASDAYVRRLSWRFAAAAGPDRPPSDIAPHHIAAPRWPAWDQLRALQSSKTSARVQRIAATVAAAVVAAAAGRIPRPASVLLLVVVSSSVQRGDEDDGVSITQHVLQPVLQLPIGVVDQNKNAGTTEEEGADRRTRRSTVTRPQA